MSVEKYFVSNGGPVFGPWALGEINRRVMCGELDARYSICKVGGQQWVPIGRVVPGVTKKKSGCLKALGYAGIILLGMCTITMLLAMGYQREWTPEEKALEHKLAVQRGDAVDEEEVVKAQESALNIEGRVISIHESLVLIRVERQTPMKHIDLGLTYMEKVDRTVGVYWPNNELLDNEEVDIVVYPAGRLSYKTVLGARSTVEGFARYPSEIATSIKLFKRLSSQK